MKVEQIAQPWGEMVVMKELSFVFCVMVAIGCQRAQADSWQPSAGHTQVSIWPATVPDPHPDAGSEVTTTREDRLVAGRPWVWVEKVSPARDHGLFATRNEYGCCSRSFSRFRVYPCSKSCTHFLVNVLELRRT